MLGARGVPPVTLLIGLRLYGEQLRDFPNATGMLDAGMARLPG